jgi:hypothetical protein
MMISKSLKVSVFMCLCVVLAWSNVGLAGWGDSPYDVEFNSTEFPAVKGAYTSWNGGYTWDGAWADKTYDDAWPQYPGTSQHGIMFYSPGINLGNPSVGYGVAQGASAGYDLPFNVQTKFDLHDGLTAHMELNAVNLGVAGRGIVRYRNYDPFGNIVNDDVWTGFDSPAGMTYSALGAPASIYTADPVQLGFSLSNEANPAVTFWGANEAGESWTSDPVTIQAGYFDYKADGTGPAGVTPNFRVDFTMMGLKSTGVPFYAGMPTHANATNAAASPNFRIDYVRTASGAIPEPVTMALLALGAGCALRRKQRK